MPPRTGRPHTGTKPNFIARVDTAIAASARQAARFSIKPVGGVAKGSYTGKDRARG